MKPHGLDLTPRELYDELRSYGARFERDLNSGDLIVTAADGIRDMFRQAMYKNLDALTAIVAEYDAPQTIESAIALIDRAEQILREVDSHGGEGNGRKGPR